MLSTISISMPFCPRDLINYYFVIFKVFSQIVTGLSLSIASKNSKTSKKENI